MLSPYPFPFPTIHRPQFCALEHNWIIQFIFSMGHFQIPKASCYCFLECSLSKFIASAINLLLTRYPDISQHSGPHSSVLPEYVAQSWLEGSERLRLGEERAGPHVIHIRINNRAEISGYILVKSVVIWNSPQYFFYELYSSQFFLILYLRNQAASQTWKLRLYFYPCKIYLVNFNLSFQISRSFETCLYRFSYLLTSASRHHKFDEHRVSVSSESLINSWNMTETGKKL